MGNCPQLPFACVRDQHVHLGSGNSGRLCSVARGGESGWRRHMSSGGSHPNAGMITRNGFPGGSQPGLALGRRVPWFIDNCSAMSSCVHGYASKLDMASMANAVQMALCGLEMWAHFERVPPPRTRTSQISRHGREHLRYPVTRGQRQRHGSNPGTPNSSGVHQQAQQLQRCDGISVRCGCKTTGFRSSFRSSSTRKCIGNGSSCSCNNNIRSCCVGSGDA